MNKTINNTYTTLLTLSATELAARIRARELSPVEVVEAHIRRIEEVNPLLNALVAERFDAAREEARQAEQALNGADPLPPLHGVPFSVKEMIGLEGMPATFGTLGRRERVADEDATIVRRLRAAGAIPLGVSNVPEWGFWFESYNLIYGRTHNPWDLGRTPGGSSGGEGALVGAGASPFGLGSDVGGSIRMPAGFCGVFGHKPTHGLLPLTGHYPVYASGPDARVRKTSPWLAVGPLARSPRDLLPLLRIMAGPDGVDPNAEAIELGDADAVEWRGRKVLLLENPRIAMAGRATEEVRGAVIKAAKVLEDRGVAIEPLPDDIFRRAAEIWSAALGSVGGPTLCEGLELGRISSVGREFGRLLLRRPRFSMPILMFCLSARLSGASERRTRAMLEEGEQLRERFATLLGDGSVLLMPPHPRVAPKHNRPLFRPFDFAYTALLNVLRIPVTVAPVGWNAEGIPLGVQIAAARGNDHLTIAAALAMEEELGGWRMPPIGSRTESR